MAEPAPTRDQRAGIARTTPSGDRALVTPSAEVTLTVNDWTTECGACGYGRGGWAASPARKGLPILTPTSRTCHGCGKRFTHVANLHAGTREAIAADPPEAAYRLWVNADRDVLVRLWANGHAEVATRRDACCSWGPPVELTEERT